jgi:hypothetical protein
MPIYLVRWPDLTASLVRAYDEEHLIDTIDEVADPGCATFEEYDGPLWIDLETPFEFRIEGQGEDAAASEADAHDEPLDPAKIQVELPEDLDEVLDMSERLFTAHLGGADTHFFMMRALLEQLFPEIAALIAELDDARLHDKPLPGPEELAERAEAAIRRELEPLVRYSWRKINTDRRDPVMAALGVTVPIGPLRDAGDERDDE